MSTENYVSFLEAMGHRVTQAAGAWWYDVGPFSYLSFPFNRALDTAVVMTARQLCERAWLVRFLCPRGQGRPSWIMICRDREYDLEGLSANNRSKVRRGQKETTVRPVSAAELCLMAHGLNADTAARQGRRVSRGTQAYWNRYYLAAERCQGAELWGAFVSNELAAYCVAFHMDNIAHILILRSSVRHLGLYVNHALLYGYLRHALRDRRLEAVSFGWEPLQGELTSLTSFKESIGFRREAAGQAIVLQPWLDRILRSPVRKLIPAAGFRSPGTERLNKALQTINWVNQQTPMCFQG